MPYGYQKYGGGFMPTKDDLSFAAQMIGANLGQRVNPAITQMIAQNPQDYYDPKSNDWVPSWMGRKADRMFDFTAYDPNLQGLAGWATENQIFASPDAPLDPEGRRQQLWQRKYAELINRGVDEARAREIANMTYPQMGSSLGREGGTAQGAGGSAPAQFTQGQGYYEEGGKVKQKSEKLADILDLIKADRAQGEVPIMAHKGEFVLNKEAAQMLGPDKLETLNEVAQMPSRQEGGGVTDNPWREPDREGGLAINEETVSGDGTWIQVSDGRWFYLANEDAKAFEESINTDPLNSNSAAIRTNTAPPSGAPAWDLSQTKATGLNTDFVQRYLNENPVSHYVVPEHEEVLEGEDAKSALAPPDVRESNRRAPMTTQNRADQRVIEEGQQSIADEWLREASAGLGRELAPPEPIQTSPNPPRHLEYATQITPGAGQEPVSPPIQPPSEKLAEPTTPDAGFVPPDRPRTPTPQATPPAPTPPQEAPTPPQEAGRSLMAPPTPFRQQHQSLGLDMEYLQNASPEDAMVYLQQVAQNRETPQTSWYQRIQGKETPLVPQQDQLFNQMVQQYAGIKGLPPALETAEAEASRATTEAEVSEATSEAQENLIKTNARLKGLEADWAEWDDENRKQMRDYELQQAALTNENFKKMLDAEMRTLGAEADLAVARSGALTQTGNFIEALSPTDIAKLSSEGFDIVDMAIDNQVKLVDSLRTATETGNFTSSDARRAAKAAYSRAVVKLQMMQDPQTAMNMSIDEYISQLPDRFNPEADNFVGEERLNENLRDQFGFDQQGFEQMRNEAVQLQNYRGTNYAVPGAGAGAGAGGGQSVNTFANTSSPEVMQMFWDLMAGLLSGEGAQ